jgi:ABC-type transport system substrate-binding protein
MSRKLSLRDSIELMRPQDAAFFRRQMSRRTALKGAAALSVAGLFAGPAALSPTAFASSLQGTPPADAAPPENQVLRVAANPTNAKVLDFYEQVYERPGVADLFSEPLVRLNKNFEIEPAVATEWSSSEDGKTWTFTLKEGLMWSDGNPVTANDYVRTFQYSADPEHAWDFTWFWDGNIVNYTEAIAGDVPVDQIGVHAGSGDYELVFETVEAAPYLPAKLLYSLPLSAAALDAHGPLYNTNPDTHVSSGPFKLEEWARDQQIVYTRNDAYTGDMNVALQKIIVKMADPATNYTLFEANQIDYMEGPAPAELKLVEADPETAKQVYQGVGDFRCFYFFFDIEKEPFTDLKVRQAFSHVLDRDTMQQQIWGRQAIPAPSFLAPGFPASNTEQLAPIQNFDPDKGKQLLADAGFPDGKGFPKLTLNTVTGQAPIYDATAEAYASALKENLNIDVEIQALDSQAFYAAMNADPDEILFGFISYGMDYFDASNMLGVWLSSGRHSWKNADFDKMVEDATVSLEDEATRTKMFQDAEKLLVEDVPAVFAYFATPIQLVKPYLTGPALEPDVNGIQAVHWPGFTTMCTVLNEIYVSADAPTGRE